VALDAHPPESGHIKMILDAWKSAASVMQPRIIPGETLGAALTGLVELLARPEGNDLRNAVRYSGGFHVIFRQEDQMEPAVHIRINDGAMVNSEFAYHGYGGYAPYGLKLIPEVVERYPARIQTTARLPFYLFETLADLWADTTTHAQSASTRSGAPGRAPLRNQDPTSIPGTNTPDGRETGKKSQALSSRWPGPSPSKHGVTNGHRDDSLAPTFC
jgi:hypothetical protein